MTVDEYLDARDALYQEWRPWLRHQDDHLRKVGRILYETAVQSLTFELTMSSIRYVLGRE